MSTEHALSVRWNRLPEQNYAESMLRKLSRSEGPTVIRAVTLSVQGAATGLYVDKEDTERHPSGAILDAVIHGEEELDMPAPIRAHQVGANSSDLELTSEAREGNVPLSP